ncbi:hypothetical protein [Kitasatospora sp. SUK 42]|uniref:hypothetical protein n=1 Tax=Kitasatospora sp. SUK 42 TaxID=1588882 RepID=UPI0018CAE405|nr:hypothetical protein [Kitasatospora sp. SUK 42]MBV2151716.1 hypothetical protein [Kitasatospora sp. SUK 42]
MSEPDKFEDDLLYALTRTGEGFRTEQADLVAGGYQRGRSRWRRRSTAAVVGGAAALALVGTGAFYLTGTTPAATGTVAAASSGTGSPAGTVAPAAAATPSATVITGDEVLATLQALLPKGEVSDAKGHGSDENRGKYVDANLVFDDGQGKSLLGISIQKHRAKDVQPRTCPADLKRASMDSCSVTVLSDGSKLFLSQGYEYPDHRATTKDWIAVLTRPDGGDISLSEWNSPQEKDAPDSRPNPPLTLDQLKAVVTDKSWDRVVAALKYDGVDMEAIDPGLSLADREAVLTGLLPAGVTVTDRRSHELTAVFELARGGKTGSLSLQIDNWAKAPDDRPGPEAFTGAVTLPDGTKLVVRGAEGNNAKAPLVADALRPDGVQVLALEPSDKQLLTVEELKAIATSPAWKPKK